MTIQKVGVIGSGVMGGGIAAQIANAGIPVVLLDIKPQEAKNGTDLAAAAVQKMLKTDPAPFMLPENAKLIETGNLEDDLGLLGDCDWVIEVVLEDLKVKHATYDKIAAHAKKGAIISSNTSTIPLAKLIEGCDKAFAQNFMITHFFNPPRYMRLLEIVAGGDTAAKAVETIRAFCDVRLGKGVVMCNDTPGFIVNRLLVYWIQAALNEAIKRGIDIETADAVMSRPLGIPKTGVFGLIDLVGVDLMPYLSGSLLETLPGDDAYRTLHQDYPFIAQMIEAGYTGRKGKGGFYRLDPDAKGKKEKQALAIDPATFNESQYKAATRPKPAAAAAGKKGPRAVLESDDDAGRYARAVMLKTLSYAASLVPEIADNIAAVDEAMRLGTNWKMGPFEMIDALGPAWLAAELEKEQIAVPTLLQQIGDGTFYKAEDGVQHYFGTDGKYHQLERPEGVLLLRDLKLAQKPVMKNGSASVWDIGDGVLCFEKTSKMNTFDKQIFEMIGKVIAHIGDGTGAHKALVFYNEGSAFSAGANLGLALFMINIAMWPQVEEFIAGGQRAFMALKYAPFPVISAPSGLALGGGCEVLLHSDHVQAHAETYTGLVEVGVGLIPAWGGCKEMILRFQARQKAQHNNVWFSPANDPMGAPRKAFETIGLASVAKSAAEAQKIGYFRDSDGITMNRDRLLYDAKQAALRLAENYEPPQKAEEIRLPGPSGKYALDMAVADLRKSGKATPYDVVVSGHLATVLSGGEADWTKPLSEDELVALERREFVKLLHNEGTMQRIEYMLDNGKPLRN